VSVSLSVGARSVQSGMALGGDWVLTKVTLAERRNHGFACHIAAQRGRERTLSVSGERARRAHPARAATARHGRGHTDPVAGRSRRQVFQRANRVVYLGCAALSATAAFARRVAGPAIHRAIATRLERHGRWLATTRTNHRCSL